VLFALVNQFNANVAAPSAGAIKPVVLPTKFDFGDNFQSEDVRISKIFRFKERYAVEAIVEVFNIFNISNLAGFGQTLNSNFGQPSLRLGQGGFGTGAPRALQFAGRFTF
jgi:hypothetical protein